MLRVAPIVLTLPCLAVLSPSRARAQDAPAAPAVAAPLPAPPPMSPGAHFRERRDALRAAIGDGAVLLRGAPRPVGMGAFGQDQDFFYLTGVAEPDLALLLAPAAAA